MSAGHGHRWRMLRVLLPLLAAGSLHTLQLQADDARAAESADEARMERLRDAIEREREALERERETRRSMEKELGRMRDQLERTREELERLEREAGEREAPDRD